MIMFCFVLFLQPINAVSWSPCGQFLAAGCVAGLLTVFDVTTKMCLERCVTVLLFVFEDHLFQKHIRFYEVAPGH